ncbi:MAG TPA: hypothetical protein VMU17_04050, partial [Elusimicrobiota bacterium]|nr:hypothetical protein [Elusimicrobiota bacterium]
DTSCDNLVNEQFLTLSINPNAAALSGDLTQVLDINYDLTRSSEASIATVLSPTGLDFSKKLYVEMWVQGDGTMASTPSGTQINVTLGQISEDADGTHGGGYTDINGVHPLGDNTPRTEDLNHNNTLDIGEDVGWTFHNPDNTTVQIGADNLHIDGEDLNRNGTLDPGTAPPAIVGGAGIGGNLGYAGADPANNLIAFGGSAPNTVDFSGWKIIRIPLNISSDTLSASNWSAIEELRISLKPSVSSANGLGTTGTIRVAKISVVGNKWMADPPTVMGSTISVRAINTEEDSNYVSPAGIPDFDALNQVNTAISGPVPAKRREQSLAIDYNFASALPAGSVNGSSVTAVSRTNSAMDLTSYGSIRFFLYGDGNNANNEFFFFRAGTDTDYLEYKIQVTWSGWREIKIKQVSNSDPQRPDHWADDPGNPGPGVITSTGLPNLTNVAQFRVGVQNNSNGANSGELWLDEIHGADVITRVGYATRGTADFEIFGWGKFGGAFKTVDRNFETFTSAITDQDRKEQTGYLDISRFSIFPMSFKGSHVHTITPILNTVNSSTLISVQQQGDVDEKSYSGAGTLQIPAWPKIGLLYDTDKIDTAALYRTDKTDHYGATFDYSPRSRMFFVPHSVSFGAKLTNLDINFGPGALLGATDPFEVSNTRDRSYDWTAKMSFQPLPGFTFNPNYALSETHEYKDAIQSTTTPTSIVSMDYDKAKTETVGMDGVLAIKRWLSPRLRYTMTDRETYGIPLAADPTAANFKTVDRTGTGEVAWDFAWRDISRRVRALQSLNVVSSYLMEDGDSWNQVASGYNTFTLLSVRQSLDPGNPEAQRANLTLRDTFRSTQRWNPFDWADWTGTAQPLRTLSVTSTFTDTKQRQETTGTPTTVLTRILPDMVMTLSQTEHFFHLESYMSNTQMNIKTQYKTVDTLGTSMEHSSANGGDWRFTLWRKLDCFFSYSRTTDSTFDEVNHVTSNDAWGDQLSGQLAFNIGKWRITPKYDQSRQQAVDSSGILTTDLTKRTPAVQFYADLFLPAGLKLPFSDMLVFSNRIRTTSTVSLTQSRSSLNAVQTNTDTYTMTTSEDYELTSNVRLTLGGSYSYNVNKVSSDANYYSYQLNSLLTIQF